MQTFHLLFLGSISSNYICLESHHVTINTYSLGNGFYIYIETSSPRVLGDVARLISPPILPSSPVCLTFWYHMYGDTIGTLNVSSLSGNSDSPDLLWSRSGNQSNGWLSGDVTIRHGGPQPVQVRQLSIDKIYYLWASPHEKM